MTLCAAALAIQWLRRSLSFPPWPQKEEGVSSRAPEMMLVDEHGLPVFRGNGNVATDDGDFVRHDLSGRGWYRCAIHGSNLYTQSYVPRILCV